MPRGRPPLGPQLVEHLDGSQLARKRLQVILQTIAGQIPVPEACRQLGIKEAAFHKLRTQVLASALDAVEPKAAGRPPSGIAVDPEVEQLRQQITQLKIDLRASQIREEIALVFPHLLKDRKAKLKKTKRKGLPDDDPVPPSAEKTAWWRGWRKPGKSSK